MKNATFQGIGKDSKRTDREGITLQDEKLMWEKGLLGYFTAKSLLDTIYFYNGKLFGLRSKEHRNLRICNFCIDSVSVTYDETVSKNFHGGLKDLKYEPRVVKHVCCDGKYFIHFPCIVKCYLMYIDEIRKHTEKIEANNKEAVGMYMNVLFFF